MRILVVGGSGFLGGAIADAARAAGHDVTILTRGLTSRPAPAGVTALTADRHADLSILGGRRFDAVFDTCAFSPDAVERLLDALDPAPGRYAFVSSTSVYGDYSRPGLTEDAEVPRAAPEDLALAVGLPPAERSSAAVYRDAYGPLKRECELAAQRRLAEGALAFRAGLLVGAGDYTDRLTWWVRRIDEGGEVPVPGTPDRAVQLVDVRDAAAFMLRAAVERRTGVYNLTSRPIPMRTLLDTVCAASGSDVRLAWIDDARALATGLVPWTEAPLWLPATDPRLRHFFEIDVGKALGDGLVLRPLEEAVADVLAWDRSRRGTALKCGFGPERAALLLNASG